MVVSHPQQLTIIFGNLLLWEFAPGESHIRFVIVTDRWNVLAIGTWPLYTRHETKTSREDLVNKCQHFCLQLPWNLIYTVCLYGRDLDLRNYTDIYNYEICICSTKHNNIQTNEEFCIQSKKKLFFLWEIYFESSYVYDHFLYVMRTYVV